MIGQRLGSFLIEEKIGSGAMGEVFRASRQLKDGRQRTAAVKVVSADFLERDMALKRFERESDILAQLRHPNIVRYYAHGKYQGVYYYAMEFVEGETLDAVLDRREFLPWPEVVELGIQLCLALQYAHDHQVVHRDLKPSNLMLTRDGQIKLTDFGIAKDLDATVNLTRTGRTLGTAAYMAPEQIRGNPPISHKTDLYALGCLLYQMLAGRPPFDGKSAVVLMHAHMAEPPPRPSGKTPDVPRALDDLVVRLMAKEPGDRPWDAAQVAHLLEELRERARRGDRVEMVFDRGREKVAAAGGALLPLADGDGLLTTPGRAPSGSSTYPGPSGARIRKPPRGKAAGSAEADARGGRRWAIETALLALALVGLLGLLAYALWPPSMETLYARAEQAMDSDSRGDWKRAVRDSVEPIERRFPEHPYAERFAEWRDRIALDEARGRALQLESPVAAIGTPRRDRPVEALYKTVLADVAPHAHLGQHARIERAWRRFVDELARRRDPDERGWLLLGLEKRAEQREALIEQKKAASALFAQATLSEQRGLSDASRSLHRRLIEGYAVAAEGDPEFLRLIAESEAAIERLSSGDAPAPPRSPAPAPARAPATPDPDAPSGDLPRVPGDSAPAAGGPSL